MSPCLRKQLCTITLAFALLLALTCIPQPLSAGSGATPLAVLGLACATYLGGGASGDPFVESANAVAVDRDGNLLVAGMTPASDFPTLNPIQTDQPTFDAFVAKFTPDCSSLIYATYLGGAGQDEAQGIAVDADGNAWVTGKTGSTDFPTLNPFQRNNAGISDAFVAKLSPAGALLYSTYLGGLNLDTGQDITVDANGNAYIVGSTASLSFPTKNALQGPHFSFNGSSTDAFITALAADGQSLIFSTYYGGSSFDNSTQSAIALAPGGDIIVTGETSSTDLTMVNPAQPLFGGGSSDAFVLRLNAAGATIVYSTYLGGSKTDKGSGVAVDTDGRAYVVGATGSDDFPTLNAFQANYGGFIEDAFAVALQPNGNLNAATFLGGSNSDSAADVAVNAVGDVLVTGSTGSNTDFPLHHPRTPRPGVIGAAVFFTQFTAGLDALRGSTVLAAGQGLSVAWQNGYTILAGWTGDPAFPTRSAYQTSLKGGVDAFIAKIRDSHLTYLPLLIR